MKRVLFVTNGHGEVAIAARIAAQLHTKCAAQCDHFALVGEFAHHGAMNDVGPRRVMPSGGLVAMGDVRSWFADIRGGLVTHAAAQFRFLRTLRERYDVVAAVGDVLALIFARVARGRHTVYVGTAKSVHVAPYGPLERRVIARADAIFVRDTATARELRHYGLPAQAANVIVDLFAGEEPAPKVFGQSLVVFPGSRPSAYEDARTLCRIVRRVALHRAGTGAWLSVAPSLLWQRFADSFRADGWNLEERDDALQPFALLDGDRRIVRAWSGPAGALLQDALIILGQAGTANEAAAAAGIPVVVYEAAGATQNRWYRMRQRGLLGEAVLTLSGGVEDAARAVERLLNAPDERARMSLAGKTRMGEPGAADRIATALAQLAQC